MRDKILRYFAFALIASVLNIAVQWFVLWLLEHPLHSPAHSVWDFAQSVLRIKESKFYLLFAMANGTASGLVLKYFLDKRFVFEHQSDNSKQEASTFFLYSLMGLFTTFIFWGVEWIFDISLPYEWAKYAGAATGLAIGYLAKFFLDRKFVFRS